MGSNDAQLPAPGTPRREAMGTLAPREWRQMCGWGWRCPGWPHAGSAAPLMHPPLLQSLTESWKIQPDNPHPKSEDKVSPPAATPHARGTAGAAAASGDVQQPVTPERA